MRVLTLLARRFVAGETADEALQAVRRLNRQGIKATLDLLGEEVKDRDQARAETAEIVALLAKIADAGLDANVSVKLTQLGLSLDPGLCRDNMARILEEAAKRGNFVRIDMEGSAYTQATLDLFHGLHRTFDNVGPVIQAYLMRSATDVDRLVQAGARVRLCKGAYKEPPSVAFASKEEVNRSYDALAETLLLAGRYPAIATHDDDRIARVQRLVSGKGLAKSSFEFQMLYGLRPRLWPKLVADGYNLRIYVPYGTHWFPYFYRRLRERKENLMFVVKGLWRG